MEAQRGYDPGSNFTHHHFGGHPDHPGLAHQHYCPGIAVYRRFLTLDHAVAINHGSR